MANDHDAAPPPNADAPHTRRPEGRVARNVAFSVISMLVATPMNVVGMLILARKLGPETVGLCFSVFAISIVVFILSGLGVSTVLTRRIAADRQGHRDITGQAAVLMLLVVTLSIIAMAACGVAWLVVKPIPNGGMLFALAAAAVALRHIMQFGIAVVVGLERFEFDLLTRLAHNGSFCLLAAATVADGPDAAVAGVRAFTLSHLLGASVITAVIVLWFGCRRFGITWSQARAWLAESAALGWGDAMRGLFWNIDSVLLSVLTTPAKVGIYNVAYRPLMPLRIAPRTLVNATFPMMSRLADNDAAGLRHAYQQSLTLLWFASLPVCVAVTACAEPFVIFAAGAEYSEAARMLRILIWMTPLLFWTTQFRFLFAAIGVLPVYSKLITLVVVAKALLLLAFTPFFGLHGACAASIIAEGLFAAFGLKIAADRGLGWPASRSLVASAPGAVVMGGALNLASGYGLVAVAAAAPVAALIYLGLGLWLGAVDRELAGRVVGRLLPQHGKPADTDNTSKKHTHKETAPPTDPPPQASEPATPSATDTLGAMAK